MPFDAYFQSLYKMAAKKPVSEFQQGVHSGDEPKPVRDPTRGGKSWQLSAQLYTQVKGGFCMGASLDWLRKVLQREDKKTVSHLKESRVLRMAQTYVKNAEVSKFGLTPKTKPLHDQAAALSSRASGLLTGPERAKKLLDQDVKAWVLANGGTCADDGRMSISGSAEVLAMFQQKIASMKEVAKEMNAAIDKHNSLLEEAEAITKRANTMVDGWNNASEAEKRAMIWNEIAAGLGTDGGKSRKFTGICPVASSSNHNYGSLRDYLVELLSAPAFTPGRGMLVSISLKPPPGHAIALHRDLAGNTFLFDPNLGVYKFTNISLLMMALVVLLDTGYAGKDDKGADTQLGSDHSWQVFARTEALLPQTRTAPLASEEDVALAYDDAVGTIQMASGFARESLDKALKEVQVLHAAHVRNETPETLEAWVNAHNEATQAFRLVRGATESEMKRAYAGWTGRMIEIK
ncbi:MAG TPA: hypothetical protein VF384_09310 [Planctomycetota bacterium]